MQTVNSVKEGSSSHRIALNKFDLTLNYCGSFSSSFFFLSPLLKYARLLVALHPDRRAVPTLRQDFSFHKRDRNALAVSHRAKLTAYLRARASAAYLCRKLALIQKCTLVTAARRGTSLNAHTLFAHRSVVTNYKLRAIDVTRLRRSEFFSRTVSREDRIVPSLDDDLPRLVTII